MKEKRFIAKILAYLGFKTCALSQWQGNYKGFSFYTLDLEATSSYPHVHVCIPKDNKCYKGKWLEDGSKIQTVVTIKLRKTADYNSLNIEFDKIYDSRAVTSENKKIWSEFLNNANKDSGYTNNWQCWFDFKRSNAENMFLNQFKDVKKNKHEIKDMDIF